jgi:hypothetical protein
MSPYLIKTIYTMVSPALKRAQQAYRSKNKQKYLDYNKKARLKYYYNNKNYQDIDNMSKSFALLYAIP